MVVVVQHHLEVIMVTIPTLENELIQHSLKARGLTQQNLKLGPFPTQRQDMTSWQAYKATQSHHTWDDKGLILFLASFHTQLVCAVLTLRFTPHSSILAPGHSPAQVHLGVVWILIVQKYRSWKNTQDKYFRLQLHESAETFDKVQWNRWVGANVN